jgi:antirestriction protein ArdC
LAPLIWRISWRISTVTAGRPQRCFDFQLREDPRAIFTAASKASQAADFLRSFSEVAEEAA